MGVVAKMEYEKAQRALGLVLRESESSRKDSGAYRSALSAAADLAHFGTWHFPPSLALRKKLLERATACMVALHDAEHEKAEVEASLLRNVSFACAKSARRETTKAERSEVLQWLDRCMAQYDMMMRRVTRRQRRVAK